MAIRSWSSALAAAAILVSFSGFLVWRLAFLSQQPRPLKDLYLEVVPPDSIALSPDGAFLAYSAPHGDGIRLHLRRLADGVVRRPEDGEGAERPFFAPDGRLGFYLGEHVRTLELEDDRARLREPITAVLPERAWVLVERDGTILASSLEGDSERELVSRARRPLAIEPGFLLFLRDGALWAARLELAKHELASEPFQVVSDVDGWYDVSANGTLAVRRPGENARRRFSIVLHWTRELERLAAARRQR